MRAAIDPGLLPAARLGALVALRPRWKRDPPRPAAPATQDSVLGPGVPATSTETFHWLDGGYFLVSSYETVFGDEPAQTGVNYWGFDSEAERFRIIFFSNNGPFTDEGNRYEGEVADGTISVGWRLRDENGDWKPWRNNTFTKMKN